MKSIKIELNCVLLNLQLAEKHMKAKDLGLVAHRIKDARRSLEEIEKCIKKAE